MILLSSLPEKYVGKQLEIDCIDIEIHGAKDHQSPIFKGPGKISGGRNGLLTYKVYNQIQVNKDIFDYLRKIEEHDDPTNTNIRLFAKSYEGIEWTGSWSVPEVYLDKAPNLLVYGEFDQLSTNVKKWEGEDKQNLTELVFENHLDLPLTGIGKVQKFHGENLISAGSWGDHHDLPFEDTSILFQESSDRSRLHVEARNGYQFTPPYIENWIPDALTFVTAKLVYPRMVIRHREKDAVVFLRQTPRNIETEMPPPFPITPSTSEAFWQSFCAYLKKCKSEYQFESLDLTKGFRELCLASRGTLQGFLISLSIYIEFCVSKIFASSEITVTRERDDHYREKIDDLIKHIGKWELDENIQSRAKGVLNMLYVPSVSKRLDTLIEHGVITEDQKKIWKKARPYLAHGNIIDFNKEEEFWHIRNHLISMAYRLIFRIIGYKGLVLDYDGNKFGYISYEWNDPHQSGT